LFGFGKKEKNLTKIALFRIVIWRGGKPNDTLCHKMIWNASFGFAPLCVMLALVEERFDALFRMRSDATIQHHTRYISSRNLLVISCNTRTFALPCVWILCSAWGNLPAYVSSLQISPCPVTMEGGNAETRQRQTPSMPIYGRLSHWPIGAVRHSSNKSIIKSTHHVEVNLTLCPRVSCPKLLIVSVWRFIFSGWIYIKEKLCIGIAVNTTIFAIIRNVSTTCFGHF